MKGTICKIPYINRIKDNILAVKSDELSNLYEDLMKYNVILPVASGRSKHAQNIPLSQMTIGKNTKTIISPEGPGFPWGSIYEAAPILEERYKEGILVLVNTGSGETDTPRTIVQNMARYIEETKTENFKIDAITSLPNSSVGRIANKYGQVIELKGKENFLGTNRYSETGIMRDMFELESSILLQMTVEALHRRLPVNMIYGLLEEELQKIGELVDESIDSAFFKSTVDTLEKRSHVFPNAKGTGEEVVKMTFIRLNHIKQAVGDEVHITNPPRPRAGDFQLSVSYSGNTQTLINTSKIFRGLGGHQFSVIGKNESELEKASDSSLILEEKLKLDTLEDFTQGQLLCSVRLS